VWVNAWLDGSEWKNTFIAANPGNTYIEIENYYVKSLSGWKGVGNIGEEDLERAKEVLRKFDIVLITEWMLEGEQAKMMDKHFRISRSIRQIKDVKGNSFIKTKYHKILAKDEASGKRTPIWIYLFTALIFRTKWMFCFLKGTNMTFCCMSMLKIWLK